jgi:hypothetical protein
MRFLLNTRTSAYARRLAALTLVLSVSVSLHAKKHEAVAPAPLPAKVLAAKTVFIQNDSGHAEIADKAYRALSAWGRYQIVDSSAKADLIVILAIGKGEIKSIQHSSTSTFDTGTGTWTYGSTHGPGTRPINFTRIELVDPVTHDTEWTDEKPWGKKKSATEELINSLQQRVEQQEKQPAK